MKRTLFLFFALFTVTTVVNGQDQGLKFAIGNEVVEIAPKPRADNADFVAVDIRLRGKVIKTFSASAVIFPQAVGSLQGMDSVYLLYRTDMGSGACAGGSLYVIKFVVETATGEIGSVIVSPVLTTCLGEFPMFSFAFNKSAEIILSIANHALNLDTMSKWVEQKGPVSRPKGRR